MSYDGKFVSVIIPAAGMGKRMRSKISKQFIMLRDRPVLAHTICKFNDCEYIDEIIIVTREDEIEYCRESIIQKYSISKVTQIVSGGKERQDSVYNGLKALNKDCDVVLIHDGARPFINSISIISGIKGAIEYGACVVGVPVKDTIKAVDLVNNIVDTPDRSTLWAVQTPQCFSCDIILRAYNRAKEEKIIATDDSMLVESLGYKVKMIMGSYKNIKITTPEDLRFGNAILGD